MDILLIDDNLAEQDQMVQQILNIDPLHDVVTAHSSYEAQQKFRKRKYDIILTEIYLQGGIPGNDLIQDVPYGCFKVGMADFLESPQIRLNFNDFLIKPVKERDLRDIITKAKYNARFFN